LGVFVYVDWAAVNGSLFEPKASEVKPN